MRRFRWLLAAAVLATALTSISRAGIRTPAPATIAADPSEPTLFHCTAGLGNARAQTGSSEAGCKMDPAPSGNIVVCWVQNTNGDRKECIAYASQWTQVMQAMNQDSRIDFWVQDPPAPPIDGSTVDMAVSPEGTPYGDCLGLTIENSSAYQPKGS